MILADEVNRATPKTQSALLEAMEEHQVTAEGETRKLPAPFFVIATQNPSEQVGTFPLPESQLDRFIMRIELGYPDRDAERALLAGTDRRDLLATLEPCMTPRGADGAAGHACSACTSSPALLDYVQAIVEHTRRSPDYVAGLSPRAALALVHSARAWALLEGPRQGDPRGRAGDRCRASPRTACARRTTRRAASTSARSCSPPFRSHSRKAVRHAASGRAAAGGEGVDPGLGERRVPRVAALIALGYWTYRAVEGSLRELRAGTHAEPPRLAR